MKMISILWKPFFFLFCQRYRTKGVKRTQSVYGKLAFEREETCPNPQGNDRKPLPPPYINNISHSWLAGRDSPFIKWALQAPDIWRLQPKWICGEFYHLDGFWLCLPHTHLWRMIQKEATWDLLYNYTVNSKATSGFPEMNQDFGNKLLNLTK